MNSAKLKYWGGLAVLLIVAGTVFHWTVNRKYVPAGYSLKLTYKGPLLFGHSKSPPSTRLAHYEEGEIGEGAADDVSAAADNELVKLVNKMGEDLSSSGFDRVATGLGRPGPTFFQTADTLGMLYHNGDLQARLAELLINHRARLEDVEKQIAPVEARADSQQLRPDDTVRERGVVAHAMAVDALRGDERGAGTFMAATTADFGEARFEVGELPVFYKARGGDGWQIGFRSGCGFRFGSHLLLLSLELLGKRHL